MLVIPLFIPASTQEAPPDFINKTTSWEVVQLVLVGIAVSYGLFSSKRNDQLKTQDKEDEHDQHAPLSYVSRLLQIPSSIFDDDDDEKQMVETNGKVVERTWNSQYYRLYCRWDKWGTNPLENGQKTRKQLYCRWAAATVKKLKKKRMEPLDPVPKNRIANR